MLFQKFLVNSRLGIETLCIGVRDHFNEIFIALVVLAQQNQVMTDLCGGSGLVVHVIGDVALAAYNRLDSLRLTCFVKFNSPVHTAVVRNGHGSLSEVAYSLNKLFYSACAVQETVFGM